MENARRLSVSERPKLHTEILDRRVAELAGRQHGVVGRWQLQEIGLTERMVRTRVAHGGLNRLHRGVYAVGHRALTVESRWMAAALAHGPAAVLSHRSAGQFWGIYPRRDIGPEVTAPGSRLGKGGIVVHRATLSADEVGRMRGIPVTSVARTMFDLAGMLKEREVERAWNEMEVRGFRLRLSVPDLIERYPGRKGTVLLADLANRETLPVGITRNDLEEAFLALIDRFGLPRPRMNAHLAVRDRFYEIDCYWEDEKVAIELDGGAAHGTTKAFHNDRERDRILTAEGYTTSRITWDHIRQTPSEVAADLRRILTPYPLSNGSGALRPLPPR
ncbi:MAG TPA: type IV toxin-antitoxin system AbiEi family antitoxin domain-containing protein [Solirubrobacterales bacterium]|nr:type IV toxin-antitoxin system AbiEi family antitoxin domain-containing protein [Solirubrobacterales bacterium]